MLDFDATVEGFRQQLGFPRKAGDNGRYPAGFLVARVANFLDSVIDPDPANVINPLLAHFGEEFKIETQGTLTKSGTAGASLYKLGSAHALYRLFELRDDDFRDWTVTVIRAVGVIGAVGKIRDGIPLGDLDPIRRLLQRVKEKPAYLTPLSDAARLCGNRVSRDSLERFRFEIATWREWQVSDAQQEQISTLYSFVNEAIRFYGGDAFAECEVRPVSQDQMPETFLAGFSEWDPGVIDPLGKKVLYGPTNDIGIERWIEEGFAPDDISGGKATIIENKRPEMSRYFQEAIQTKSFYLRLYRPFDVLDGRCLTVPEANDLIVSLLRLTEDEGSELDERIAASIVLLQMVTCWSYATICKASWNSKVGPGSITEAGAFMQSVPNYHRFCKWVGPNKTSGFVSLNLPRTIMRVLHEVSPYRLGARIFGGNSEDQKKSVSELFVKLRKKNKRIRADRIAETMPTLLYDSSKDLRQVQLICGSGFGLSPWPLFYYGVRNSVLMAQYQDAIGRLFQDDQWETKRQCGDYWVGSSLGGNFEMACEIVNHLESSVQVHERRGRKNGPRSLESWLEYLNALSRKTAFMLGAPAGFRNFDSIGELTILDFFLRADANSMLAGEKGPDSAHLGYRISSLGIQLVRNQFRVLLAKYQQFVASRHKTPLALTVKCKIKKALTGEGGLFLSFDAEQGASVATQAWLKAGLPSNDMPVNFFRHVMASKWVASGGTSRDLFTQIGHAGYADHRFSDTALDSPYLFLKRAEPLVEKIMADMGWTVTVIDKNLKFPADGLQSGTLAQTVRFMSRRDSSDRENTLELRQMEFRDACREFVAFKLEDVEPGSDLIGAEVEQECISQIDSLQKTMRIDDSEIKKQDSSELYKQLVAEFCDDSCDVRASYSDENKYLRPKHMDAWSVVHMLREHKRRVDTGKAPQLADSVSMAMDLLLGRPFRDKKHFLSVLDSIQDAQLLMAPKNIVEVKIEADGHPSVEWISPSLALQLGRYARIKNVSKDLSQELVKVMRSLGLRGVDFKYPISRLISFVQSCARIEYPGLCLSAYLASDFQSPLSSERTDDWRKNEYGNGEGWPENLDRSDASRVRAKRFLGEMPWDNVVAEISGLIADATPETRCSMSQFRAKVQNMKIEINRFSDGGLEKKILIDYLSRISAGGAKKGGGTLAISTVAKYQNIATTALRWMNSEHVNSPQEAYELILGDGHNNERSGRLQSSSYQRSKIEALRRFDDLLASEYGFDRADSHTWSNREGYQSPAKAEVISEREYRKAISILMDWSNQCDVVSGTPARLFKAAVCSLMLMYECGLRPEESIGLALSDLIYADAEVQYIVIRTNQLRRTKNRPQQRLVCLSEVSTELRDVIRILTKQSQQAFRAGGQQDLPLLVSQVRYAQDSKFIGDTINACLRIATGSNSARRYSCRHSFVNRKIQGILEVTSGTCFTAGKSINQNANFDIVDIAVRAGHSRVETTARHYTHIGHLGVGLFGGSGEYPSKALTSVWRGRRLPKHLRVANNALEVAGA